VSFVKKFLFLAVLLILVIVILGACSNSNEDSVTQDDIETSAHNGGLHGHEVSFDSVEGLFGAMRFMYNSTAHTWVSYIVRVEILNERLKYMDSTGDGYFYHTIKSAQVYDVFYGEIYTGDIIEIRIPPTLASPLAIGDDVVLFLVQNKGREGTFPILVSSFQSVYRTPSELAYPQSITSSILTRTLPDELILESVNPYNPIILTVQDLARIAGLCDSPWPGQNQPEMYPYLIPHTDTFIEVEIRP